MPTLLLHTPAIDVATRARIIAAVPGQFEQHGRVWHLCHDAPIAPATLAALRQELPFDINPLPEGFASDRVRLLVTDMDSTLINIECIDEIADFAGCKPAVAAITEAAMRGEMDFRTSLQRRVETLAGLDEGALMRVYDERLCLNPGAETMIEELHRRGVQVALVSGGFTFFTERLQARLGLDHVLANTLESEQGRLTGRVLGDIVDAEGKAAFLQRLCRQLNIAPTQAIAMGDGANDLKMLRSAGLGIAYHAKPKVQEQAHAVINHGDLTTVLDFLE